MAADLPVKNGQSGVNRDGNILPGSFNERTDIADKIAGKGHVVFFCNPHLSKCILNVF